MSELTIFLLFLGVGCFLWGIFYGKKVKKNDRKK